MPSATPDTVRQQIAARRVDALYLLHGPDETAKSELSVAFADVVDAELRAFNVERLYGGEVSPVDVVDAARTLPMMSERRVVVVLQAERVLQPKRESEAAAEALGALESYIQSPVPSTVARSRTTRFAARTSVTTALAARTFAMRRFAPGTSETARCWPKT